MTTPSERINNQIAEERNLYRSLLAYIATTTTDLDTMLLAASALGRDAEDLRGHRRRYSLDGRLPDDAAQAARY